MSSSSLGVPLEERHATKIDSRRRVVNKFAFLMITYFSWRDSPFHLPSIKFTMFISLSPHKYQDSEKTLGHVGYFCVHHWLILYFKMALLVVIIVARAAQTLWKLKRVFPFFCSLVRVFKPRVFFLFVCCFMRFHATRLTHALIKRTSSFTNRFSFGVLVNFLVLGHTYWSGFCWFYCLNLPLVNQVIY